MASQLMGKVVIPSAKEWDEAKKQLKATLQLTFEKGAYLLCVCLGGFWGAFGGILHRTLGKEDARLPPFLY